jgi:hypothetical protein
MLVERVVPGLSPQPPNGVDAAAVNDQRRRLLAELLRVPSHTRVDGFKLSSDPLFVEKVYDVQVERWFAFITDELIRRGNHQSVQALEADIRAWARGWNEDPMPFIWTKPAEQILESIGRLLTRISGAGH